MNTLAARPRYAVVFKRALLWLVFLAPFFYLTYGLANWYASRQPDVGSIVFSWERAVPFLAWTIVPYWSINLFYGLSLFLNDTPAQVSRLAGRYLTAQLVACICFVAFPLAASFIRPESDGLPGFMFDALTGFDKPFNQAPSLHIALLVIIWDHLRRLLPPLPRYAWNGWCLLIGGSVLTTYQHHFIDIPTGALLGLFALWLFPREGALPFAGFRLAVERKRLRLAGFYTAGALGLLAAGWIGARSHPAWLIMLWPSLSLAIVAFAYLGAGPQTFQKSADGSVTLASRLLLWPYRLAARINAWAWTRTLSPSAEIADGVYLGRFPSTSEARRFHTVIDLAAEFEHPRDLEQSWIAVPMLDLASAAPAEICRAASFLEQRRTAGPILVCCALGFQRSAMVVARWMIDTGRAANLDEAEALMRSAGRPVRLRHAAENEAS